MEYGDLYNKKKENKPIKEVSEKWKLVPAFLRLRGLVKQHIDSFNFFINHEIKKIVMVNGSMTSNAGGPDIDFYFKFTDIKIGMPIVSEDRVAEKIFP